MVAIMKDKALAPATKDATNLATILKLGVAALPLYPAIKINLDAAQGQGSTWSIVAIGFVVFGAICIENATHFLRGRQAVSALLWGFLGLAFLALNVMNALGNAASHSDHSRDQNRSMIAAAATFSEQRSQWSQRRAEQAKVAGEATPESIEAEAKALKAREARLWSASFQCDPRWITKDATKAFCAEVATLEAKKAAATKRDQLDAQLATLDAKAETKGEAPSTVDSFADAMADGFSAFGYSVDEKGKVAIVRARDWGKALGVELLAGFGPAGLLLLFMRSSHAPAPIQTPLPAPAKKTAGYKAAAPVAVPVLVEQTAPSPAPCDDYQAFVLRSLEPCQGENIPAGELWKAWQDDCKARDIEPGTQQAFGRAMKKRLRHDKNNGRPRYCDIRIKVAATHAPLRLVVNG